MTIFSLRKIVEKTNHMVFQEVSFATINLKEGAAFGLDQNTSNSRQKQPSSTNKSMNNLKKLCACNHVS